MIGNVLFHWGNGYRTYDKHSNICSLTLFYSICATASVGCTVHHYWLLTQHRCIRYKIVHHSRELHCVHFVPKESGSRMKTGTFPSPASLAGGPGRESGPWRCSSLHTAGLELLRLVSVNCTAVVNLRHKKLWYPGNGQLSSFQVLLCKFIQQISLTRVSFRQLQRNLNSWPS